MELASSWYESVALIYMRMVQLDSPEAVVLIEEIRVGYGSHAAMCAAVAIAITKLDVQQDGLNPDMGIYTQLLKGYPEALPLLQRAVEFCLPKWRIQFEGAVPQQDDYLTNLPGS